MPWLHGLLASVSATVVWLAIGWGLGRAKPADPDARRSRYMHRREPLLVWAANLLLLAWSPLVPWRRLSLPWQYVAIALGSAALAMVVDSAWFHRKDASGKELLMLALVPAAFWSGAWLVSSR